VLRERKKRPGNRGGIWDGTYRLRGWSFSFFLKEYLTEGVFYPLEKGRSINNSGEKKTGRKMKNNNLMEHSGIYRGGGAFMVAEEQHCEKGNIVGGRTRNCLCYPHGKKGKGSPTGITW